MGQIPMSILMTVITSVVGAIATVIVQKVIGMLGKKKVASVTNGEAPETVGEENKVKKENKIINFFKNKITICCILFIISFGFSVAPVIIFMVKPVVTVNSFLFWFSIVAFVGAFVIFILWTRLAIKECLDYIGHYFWVSILVGSALAIVADILLHFVSKIYFWLVIICSVAVLFTISFVCVCFRRGREGKIFSFVTNCMFVVTFMFLIISELLFIANLFLVGSYKTIFTYKNHYYMKNEDGTFAFVMSDYNEVNLIIPSEVKGKAVTSLRFGPEYLEGNKDYVSIVLPDSIESIPQAMFRGCSKLESLTLPVIDWEYESDIVDYDGKAMIQGRLGNLFGTGEFENSVAVEQSSMGRYISGDKADENKYYSFFNTYYLPKSLHSVTMNGGIVRYGTFMNCTEITEVKLNVEGIEKGAFENCGAIKSYEGMSYIDNWVIEGKSSLTAFTLKEETVGIADKAFKDGKATKIILNENLKYIGESAISGTKISEVTIPASVISIKNGAFSNCSSLKNATFDNAINWYANEIYVSSESLHNTQTAATYLTSTYKNYIWTRRV